MRSFMDADAWVVKRSGGSQQRSMWQSAEIVSYRMGRWLLAPVTFRLARGPRVPMLSRASPRTRGRSRMHAMPGSLSGVRVVDCSTVVLGPWAAQQLGDLGADVIKIEPPEGDTTRQLGPMRNPAMGAFYLAVNRNKRSIVLDLKQEAARRVL